MPTKWLQERADGSKNGHGIGFEGPGVEPQAPHPNSQRSDLIRTNMHREYDSPEGIGAIPPETRLTAPVPWEGIAFKMHTRRD